MLTASSPRLLWARLLCMAALAGLWLAAPAHAGASVVVAGPATGRHAETLPAMLAGAQRGADGAEVIVTDVDDGCDAGRAEGAARLIIAGKPDLVIGHPCPAAAIAAARIYAAANVVFIALGVRHPDLTDKRAGPTIFRLAGRDDRQGPAAADELAVRSPLGRIAIVQDRTAYARGLTAAVTAALAARNLPPPVVVPIVAGRRDYDQDLAKLKTAPPEAVFFAGYPPEAAVVLRGLRKAGIGAAMIASDANATEEFARAATARNDADLGGVVKVMLQAPGSGGFDANELAAAAAHAVAAWRAAWDTGNTASALSTQDLKGVTTFGELGDARLASFTAVPLVAGRWATNANASE
jgi:branched-chain amino acid transport system substrate-binding protein